MKITIIILFVIGFLLTSAFSLNDAFANDGSLIDEIETLEHDTVYGYYNSMVQVDADTYALAYQGDGYDGFISTFTISADGSTITEVATLEHDTELGTSNSLVQVDADTYALAYTGTGNDGFISTFTISADGSTITEVATLEHDTVYGIHNSMVQVDADTYALAYQGTGNDGFISTFTINSAGAITAVKTQSLGNNLEHDTVYGNDNSLVQVDSDTYALAYAGDGNDGFISTFTIDSAGAITAVKTQSLGNNLEHDTVYGYDNSLVQVDSDTYALAYAGDGDDGFISTFTISADGSTITEVESLEHDTVYGYYNSMVQVDSDTYALAYAQYDGDGNDGFISTFTIDSDGDITPIRIQNHGAFGSASVNLEHDTVRGTSNSLVQVDSDTYALAYEGDGNDGFISTFTIDSDGDIVAEETKKSGSDCYDCKPPTLQQAQIQIASAQKIIATDDEPLHITANVGNKVTVILNVTDNKSVDTIPFAALYTNYQEKPSDMNAFYANNFDKWKHVSTSFYEWNVRADDVPYDYDGTISWSDNAPTVVTDVITDENYFMINDGNVLEYFMMPFTFTMNDSMKTSQIIAKIYDASGNRLYETLPVTLEIIPKEIVVLSDAEEIAILDKGDVIITPSEDTTPLLNEPVLFTVLSQWSGYSQVTSDDAEMLSVMGLQGDSLPAWTKNLGEWVIQEKLDVSELITAINYVHNNQ